MARLEAEGSAAFYPLSPAKAGVGRQDVRELVRRGLVVEREGIVFPAAAVDGAARVPADLLLRSPQGFTVAQLREALGTTRKFAMPLVALLDAHGLARRRGDVRIEGPGIPPATATLTGHRRVPAGPQVASSPRNERLVARTVRAAMRLDGDGTTTTAVRVLTDRVQCSGLICLEATPPLQFAGGRLRQ